MHFAGFEFGHIENVINQVKQKLSGRTDIYRILDYLIVDVFTKNHFVKTDDGINRCTDFMAHAREELILCGIEHFDFLFLLLRSLFLLRE